MFNLIVSNLLTSIYFLDYLDSTNTLHSWIRYRPPNTSNETTPYELWIESGKNKSITTINTIIINTAASMKLFLEVAKFFPPSDKYLINLNKNIAYKSIESRKLAIISRNGIIPQRWAKRQNSKLKARNIWKTWKHM